MNLHDYQTGARILGAPSPELVAASLRAGDTGAVLAIQQADGSWDRCDPRDANRLERAGRAVRTVYVAD